MIYSGFSTQRAKFTHIGTLLDLLVLGHLEISFISEINFIKSKCSTESSHSVMWS